MNVLNNNLERSAYNKQVKQAYFQILRQTRNQIATLQREEMRYSLEREDRSTPKIGTVIHEIITPLIYLRLECHPNKLYAIHFGFEQVLSMNAYSALTTFFIRQLYKLTGKDNTEVNIEDAVRTDWMINQPSEMYEHIEDRQKHHIFKLIKYKPASNKRKQMKAVA